MFENGNLPKAIVSAREARSATAATTYYLGAKTFATKASKRGSPRKGSSIGSTFMNAMKLLINEQRTLLDTLNQIVRSTEEFRTAEAAGRLIKIPTGDGMALIFYKSPEEPVECALEINRALKEHPELSERMGIHSGPVNEVADVNERTNITGAGINVAQRVMDCGDAGHILLCSSLKSTRNSANAMKR